MIMALTISSITVAPATKTRVVRTRAESELASKLAALEVGKAMICSVEYDMPTAEKIERLSTALDDKTLPDADRINVQLAIQALENATVDSEVTKLRSLTYHVMDRHPEVFASSRLAMSVDRTAREITIAHLNETRKARVKVSPKTVDIDAILKSVTPPAEAN